MTGRDSGPIASVTAALTLIIGVVAVFRSAGVDVGRRVCWGLAGLVGLGTAVELIGVRTGLPFGRYAYTENWRPVFSVPGIGPFPLQLPLAWAMMVGASTLAVVKAGRGAWPKWAYAVGSGLLAAVADLAMEPVMTGPLAYWRWIDWGPLPGGAPVLNFIGWWATATVGAALLLSLNARAAWRRPDALYILAGHLTLLAGIFIIGPMPISR